MAGSVGLYQVSKPVSSEELTNEIVLNLEKVIRSVHAESEKVKQHIQAGKGIPATSVHFVVICNNSVIDWNDYHFIPYMPVLKDNFITKFYKSGDGEFLLNKYEVAGDTSLVAIIPLHIQYKIQNQYLAPYWNQDIFSNYKPQLSGPEAVHGISISLSKNVLFKVNGDTGISKEGLVWNRISLLSWLLTLLVLFLLAYRLFNRMTRFYPAGGFVVLTGILVMVRVGMIALDFPARFTNSPLFDAGNFASSDLNPSLGDLFLNVLAVCVLAFYLFKKYYRFQFIQRLFLNNTSGVLVVVGSVVCILFGMLYPFVVIQTIYNNSVISLSISDSIHFDLLRIVAFLSMVISWISSFFFIHVFLRLLAHEKRLTVLLLSIVGGSLIFIEINIASGQSYFWSFLFGLIFLVSVLSFSLFHTLQYFQYKTFLYFMVALVCLSLNGMVAIRHFAQQRNMQSNFRLADHLLDERDYLGEYLLQETAERIGADAFILSRMTSPLLGKETVVQKIKQIYLSGYFNRYSTSVFLFDVSGNVIGSDSVSFSSLINFYKEKGFQTEYANVYYTGSSHENLSRKYIVVAPLQKAGVKIGYVVLELLQKRVIPENVYPELLVDTRFQPDIRTQELSYAVVTNNTVRFSAGDFNYDSFTANTLKDSRLYSIGLSYNGYLHIAQKDVNGRVAVVSYRKAPAKFWVADFSFQVVLGVAILLLFLTGLGIYSYYKSRKLFMAVRIQLILNLAFFFPLITVSIITLNVTTRSSQEQLNSEYLVKAARFGEVVALRLQESADVGEFDQTFTNLTSLVNLDANVFHPNGTLMTTSQPLIFENNLLSTFMKPSAYKRVLKGDKNFVANERVGSLQFYVAYAALFSPETGDRIGVLAVPFFQSASSLEQLQITVLTNILSIFTLVFIVLLAVSYLVTQWLTAPLRLITKTLGKISLLDTNRPLDWKSDDEIGMVAKEYNQMLVKLQDSKQELERSQRERAWREIAQQVAHEIKNPLTPMKLTLQQLEQSKKEQTEDQLKSSVRSLLAQVNTLDDIASSFSSFARMPEPVLKEIELVSLLRKTIDLHSHEGSIEFQVLQEELFVKADEKLLGRIFSNLLLNALQAARAEVPLVIRIAIERRNLVYRISFVDNGRGIDSMLIDKIFLPHFTTKESGSGLGLAISRQGIEQMGGKIWFETSVNGTTFIIELPRIK